MIQIAVDASGVSKKMARLIQRNYYIDPFLCPKCLGCIKIISFTEDFEIVKKNLKFAGSNANRCRKPIA
jgi:hypothetical protein